MRKIIFFALAIFIFPLISFGATYGADFLGGVSVDCSDGSDYAYANDGNIATFWNGSGVNNFPHWIIFDTADLKIPAKIRIAPYSETGHTLGVKNFTLEGSNDDVDYFNLYTGLAEDADTGGVFQDFEFTPTTTEYRYFKLNFTDSYTGGNNYTAIYEIQGMECLDCGGTSSSTYATSSLTATSRCQTYILDGVSTTDCYDILKMASFYYLDYVFFISIIFVILIIAKTL